MVCQASDWHFTMRPQEHRKAQAHIWHRALQPRKGRQESRSAVPIEVYDQTIEVLKSAIARAKLGNEDRLEALRRRDEQTRRLEREVAAGPSLPEFVAEEKRRSHEYAGRSVFGWESAPAGDLARQAARRGRKADTASKQR
jgi:hypothetical protein